jgi:hypothetical protein
MASIAMRAFFGIRNMLFPLLLLLLAYFFGTALSPSSSSAWSNRHSG